jgi:DNA-binding LytR/AlgR family response regulator
MSNLTTHRDALLTVDSKRNIALFIDRIIMLEGEGNYTVFHLRTYEEILQAKGFLRVHKSFMVNPKYVVDYRTEDCQLLLENNLVATVARRRKGVLGIG